MDQAEYNRLVGTTLTEPSGKYKEPYPVYMERKHKWSDVQNRWVDETRYFELIKTKKHMKDKVWAP